MPLSITHIHDLAEAWMTNYLATHGPTLRSKLMADAKAAGYSEGSIRRASEKLNLVVVRGAARGGPSTWSLPAGEDSPQASLPTQGADQ